MPPEKLASTVSRFNHRRCLGLFCRSCDDPLRSEGQALRFVLPWAAIPEPSSLILLVTGILCGTICIRRHAARSQNPQSGHE